VTDKRRREDNFTQPQLFVQKRKLKRKIKKAGTKVVNS